MNSLKTKARTAVATLAIITASLTTAAQPAAKSKPNTIENLYDAFGPQKKGTVLDWGFSVLIEYRGKTILFDSGNDLDKFRHNVQALGVDLQKVDVAVLSHRHLDHISGFQYMLQVKPQVEAYLPDDAILGAPPATVVPPPSAETAAALPSEQLYFGGKRTEVSKPSGPFPHAKITYVSKTRQIGPGMWLIYTKSPLLGEFNGYPPSEPGHPQMIGMPEISLALETDGGIALITGCSHSKVEAIAAAAREATGKKIALLDGGFHLLLYDAATIEKLANQLKNELGVERVAPAHCTGNLGFKILKQVYGPNYSYAGVESVVEF
jgi:7,8-dihydropterin-6-yl-methyl-4-(beta-D-ribofuranosyl)aminobenzene 5'-phosphate synthase